MAPTSSFPVPWPLVTLVLGIGIGVWLGRSDAPPAPSAPAPVAAPNKPGELKKLDDKEKAELAARREAASKTQEPSPDSPFLAAGVTADLQADATLLGEWRSAIAAMEQGNARQAKPILTKVEAGSAGKSYQDAAQVLLAEARVNTGEVESGRALLATWRAAHADSPFRAQGLLTEGKAFMQEARRSGPERKAGEKPSPAQVATYQEALGQWEQVVRDFPTDPASADALFHRVALLGELGDAKGAEQAAQQLLASFPSSRHTPRGLANAGRIALDAGEHELASRLYQSLVDRFPQDRLAQQARTQLQGLKTLGKVAPELEIAEWVGPDLGSLASMRGKVVVLVFWATWCPHCRKAMPEVEARWKAWKDKGVNVIAVTRHTKGQTTESVRAYIDENGYTMPVAVDAGTTSRAYGVSGIPAAAIIDKNGKVAFQNHPAQITDALIQSLVGG